MVFRYVHNNIFFSFAIDADLEELSQRRPSEELRKAESTAQCQTYSDKNEEILSQAALSESTVGGSSVPHAGTVNGTEASPDVPAETPLAESEQATYASANNDLKGTKAFQEANVPGLYSLAMAIIDYRGHRVVAQVWC